MEFEVENIDFDSEPAKEEIKEKPKRVEKADLYKKRSRHILRQAFGEVALLDILGEDKEFKKGYTYHILTGGDIDSLTYLKHFVRYNEIDYLLVSTWCMNMADLEEIENWVKIGKIKKLDFYLGEIFKGSYRKEYEKLKEMTKTYNITATYFHNHSKIISGNSKEYYFNVESSANMNTNPRTENASITIDKGLHLFYRDYYNNIKSIDR